MENFTLPTASEFDPIVPPGGLLPNQRPEVAEQYAELADYEKAKPRIQRLIGSRSRQIEACKARRQERYVELDVRAMQERGDLLEDETMIPVRVIDSNISASMPDSMAFLNSNFRLAIFHCVENPEIKPRNLEFEFTRVCTYQNWSRDFARTFDGSKLHGWDAMEVVFDATKPGHVAFEHVGYDKLYFNTCATDLQDSEIVLREYDVTLMTLWSFITDNGFDSEQVYKVCSADQHIHKRDKTVRLYKYYYKLEGVVYVGWLSLEGACTNWLKAPAPLRLGIYTIDDTGGFQERDIDQYPIFQRIDKDDEQELIDEKKGRGFLDGPQQEATTALTSSFVNGTMRASNIFAAPDSDDTETTEMKMLDLQLIPGGIYNKPMKFWSPPYPEVTLLSGLQYLGVLNQQQTGKLSAAVSNRKDARKTAEELSQAKDQEQRMSSVNAQADSEFLRGVFSFAWLIVQSQALQSKINFLKVKAQVDPALAATMSGDVYVNDFEQIAYQYDVRPAGDTDIIEAEQEINKMMADWPVIQTIPGLSEIFIKEFIRLRYPKKADDYLAAMAQGDPGPQLVQALSTLASAFAQPNEIAALGPKQQQQLVQIGQQIQAYLASKQPQPQNQ